MEVQQGGYAYAHRIRKPTMQHLHDAAAAAVAARSPQGSQAVSPLSNQAMQNPTG